MQKLINLLNLCFQKKIPFVSYRHPGDSKIYTIIHISGKIIYVENPAEVINDEGFIYAPFHRKTNFPVVFFRPEVKLINDDIDDGLLEKVKNIKPYYPEFPITTPLETTRKEYLEKADIFINSFTKDFTKAVLSRVKITDRPHRFQPADYFLKLTEKYPDAFCHLISVPGNGIWTGATPELLLSTGSEISKTVSLAGTRKNNDEEVWSAKEIEEQRIVTEYIENILRNLGVNSVEKEPVKTIKAGDISHLFTVFKFKTKDISGRVGELINELHPTPAVCGFPKEKALNLILKTEKHNREYYSGFLGTIDANGQRNFYVNLRCMKILPEKLAVFTGGGLTKDSLPEKEWEETVLKSQTLLHVT